MDGDSAFRELVWCPNDRNEVVFLSPKPLVEDGDDLMAEPTKSAECANDLLEGGAGRDRSLFEPTDVSGVPGYVDEASDETARGLVKGGMKLLICRCSNPRCPF